MMISLNILAQDTGKTATISAQGNSSKKVSPDVVMVYMSISSITIDYNQVVSNLASQYSQLEKELVMAGFKKDDLKTINYTINKHSVWDNGRSKDSGYIGNQSMVIKFENDNRKIANLVNTISKGKVDINFNFSFGLSEAKKEATSQELIKQAVKDANSKANVIASASAVRLKKIMNIHYSTPVMNHPMYETHAMKMDSSAGFGGFNSNEIEMTDTILITWEIE